MIVLRLLWIVEVDECQDYSMELVYTKTIHGN
jgi:hypothetical protein